MEMQHTLQRRDMLGVLLGWMGDVQEGLEIEIYEAGTSNVKWFLGVFLSHVVPSSAVFLTALIYPRLAINSSL